MKLLFIDHFDSFTNNLTSWFASQGVCLQVVSYQNIGLIHNFNDVQGVVFSPGPGHPDEYPDSYALYRKIPQSLPFLGVCLGHQIFLSAEGGDIVQICETPEHGRQITVLEQGAQTSSRLLSQNALKGSFVLYNSLGCFISDNVFRKNIVSLLQDGGVNLVAEHKLYPRIGVQFHPESFASPMGYFLLHDFLRLITW